MKTMNSITAGSYPVHDQDLFVDPSFHPGAPVFISPGFDWIAFGSEHKGG